jgi:hypothetical protein
MNTPRNPLPGIPNPFSVTVDGRVWNLFSADFLADGGTYSIHFYAISHEHALHILDDIKSTAKLSGQCLEAYKE